MEHCCHICAGPASFSCLSWYSSKATTQTYGWWIIFYYTTPFPYIKNCKPLAALWLSPQHVFCLATSLSPTIHAINVNHLHSLCISLIRSFFQTGFRQDVSLITLNLTSSSQGSTDIFPAWTSLLALLSLRQYHTVTLYHEWFFGFVLGDH